ncbi:indole-3-glycerol phosphate synthase TrpC [Kallotenue papyrolyticum]|uniref:indole-3-glycerol phosphate synthase TrpC n=1 Tax=Kallotenue papyrolyticum TaxID=1325125 RepID=UPI000478639D|nr:indole-3-glycerol phosphate synthase TrpC [Kallotenue papyrolyticum]
MSTETYLDRILAHKREEIARQRLKVPFEQIRQRAADAPPARPFAQALRQPHRLALIAEIKHKSPSKGVLLAPFDPLALARTYLDNGADALSVLTDVRFFGGSLQYLKAIRELQATLGPAGQAPLLRKDFVLDPYQVYEARAYGADAVLLIVAALEDALLRELLALSQALGMDALVEVHDETELERALAAGATVIGVNNRDLRTFYVDLATTERLAAHLTGCDRPVLVAESGIAGAADLARLRACQADAILVGEAIVTASDIAAKVRELAGRGA